MMKERHILKGPEQAQADVPDGLIALKEDVYGQVREKEAMLMVEIETMNLRL